MSEEQRKSIIDISNSLINFKSKKFKKNNIVDILEKDLLNTDIEKALDEMDEEIKNKNIKFLTHEEVFSKLRRNLKIE